MKDNDTLAKKLGVSSELTENTQVECRICNLPNGWAIQIYPPLERNDIMYFILYDKQFIDDIMSDSVKMCRISITSPSYIQCSDCSKMKWILNEDEKQYLFNILKENNMKLWEILKNSYSEQLLYYDNRKLDLSNIQLPDYRLL